MKKTVSLILALALIVMAFAGCAAQPEEEDVVIRIGGLKGPTSMGLVKVMEDDETGASANDYEFTIAGSADEVTPKLIQGELDIAAVPANLASVLYNNTEGCRTAAGHQYAGRNLYCGKGRDSQLHCRSCR